MGTGGHGAWHGGQLLSYPVQADQTTASGAVAGSDLPLLRTCPHSFYVSPVSENEMKHIIFSLKNKKSTGFDRITVELMKVVVDEFVSFSLSSLI